MIAIMANRLPDSPFVSISLRSIPLRVTRGDVAICKATSLFPQSVVNRQQNKLVCYPVFQAERSRGRAVLPNRIRVLVLYEHTRNSKSFSSDVAARTISCLHGKLVARHFLVKLGPEEGISNSKPPWFRHNEASYRRNRDSELPLCR